jgi:hypothetical protein
MLRHPNFVTAAQGEKAQQEGTLADDQRVITTLFDYD